MSAATYGVLYRQSCNPRLRENVGALEPLGEKGSKFGDRAGFLAVIEGCDIDKTLEYLAYRRSGEINRDAVEMMYPFILYDFKTGMIAELSNCARMTGA